MRRRQQTQAPTSRHRLAPPVSWTRDEAPTGPSVTEAQMWDNLNAIIPGVLDTRVDDIDFDSMSLEELERLDSGLGVVVPEHLTARDSIVENLVAVGIPPQTAEHMSDIAVSLSKGKVHPSAVEISEEGSDQPSSLTERLFPSHAGESWEPQCQSSSTP